MKMRTKFRLGVAGFALATAWFAAPAVAQEAKNDEDVVEEQNAIVAIGTRRNDLKAADAGHPLRETFLHRPQGHDPERRPVSAPYGMHHGEEISA